MAPELEALQHQTLIERLAALAPLAAGDRHVAQMHLRGRLGSRKSRAELVGQGVRADRLFLLLDGWALQTRTLPDGRRQITGVLLPGDFCDLHALIGVETLDALHAANGVAFLDYPMTGVRAAIERAPAIGQSLCRHALILSAIQREWIVNLGQRTGLERVSHLLCELQARLALIGRATPTVMEMPLTQVELADATGLTAVHLNRVLQALRAGQLVETGNRTIRFPDLERLQRLACFVPDYLTFAIKDRAETATPTGRSPAAMGAV